MIFLKNDLLLKFGGVIHRKIKAKLIKGDFLDSINKLGTLKKKRCNVYIIVPRLPFLVKHNGSYKRSHIKLFLEQLPENTQIRIRFGNLVLRIYLDLLACFYCKCLFKMFSLLQQYRFKINDDGDFIIVTNTALVSVNTAKQLATRYYLVEDLKFFENDIKIRLKRHKDMIGLKEIFERGYIEEFILPEKNIYSYVRDVGEQTFFKSTIERMTSFYNEMPTKDMILNEYIHDIIQLIEKSRMKSWILTSEVMQLIEFCNNINNKKTIKLCTLHGDLKVDQFIYSKTGLFLMDWEFSKLSLPEYDFVNFMICFDNIHDLLKQPDIFEKKYIGIYREMKNAIQCANLLSVKNMIGLYLLETIGVFCRLSQIINLTKDDFNRYILTRVNQFISIDAYE